jgi:hypothetical protein
MNARFPPWSCIGLSWLLALRVCAITLMAAWTVLDTGAEAVNAPA